MNETLINTKETKWRTER